MAEDTSYPSREHWQEGQRAKLPRGVMDSSSLEIKFKSHLGTYVYNLL